MPPGGDVVLLNLLPLFPGLRAGDGKDLVQLAGVVDTVPGNDRDDSVKGAV